MNIKGAVKRHWVGIFLTLHQLPGTSGTQEYSNATPLTKKRLRRGGIQRMKAELFFQSLLPKPPLAPSRNLMTELWGQWQQYDPRECVIELCDPSCDDIQMLLTQWTRRLRTHSIWARDNRCLDMHSGSGPCPIAATTTTAEP